jgi:TPR repeat protein
MLQKKLRESFNEVFAKAVKWYNSDRAALHSKAFSTFQGLEKIGHVSCLKYLANCYLEGRGCDQDTDKAREYFIASIALGHYDDLPKPSSYEMIRQMDGEIYGSFDDAEDTFNSNVRHPACIRAMYINYVNSIVYGINRIAWLRLGDMYFDGIGVEERKKWAVYFYRKAYLYKRSYDEIDSEIEFKIGKCLYYGEGIEKDVALAKWFLIMAQLSRWPWGEPGDADMCEKLLSAIGGLDEMYWEEDEYLDEEDYLDCISGDWLCSEPDYI